MSKELQDAFFYGIPYEYTISTSSGDVDINVSKRYANQMIDMNGPAIVVSYVTSNIPNYIYLNEMFTMTHETIEDIDIEDGETEYRPEVSKPKEIEWIKKYVVAEGDYFEDGWELIDSEEYTLVDSGTDDAYILFDNVPDTDTIKIKYSHYSIRAEYGGEFQDRIQLDVITTDYKEDDTFINGLLLNKEITTTLMKELRFGFDHPDISVRSVEAVRDMTSLMGEDYHYRNSFDIVLAYHDTYTKILDSIDEVNYELQSQVI